MPDNSSQRRVKASEAPHSYRTYPPLVCSECGSPQPKRCYNPCLQCTSFNPVTNMPPKRVGLPDQTRLLVSKSNTSGSSLRTCCRVSHRPRHVSSPPMNSIASSIAHSFSCLQNDGQDIHDGLSEESFIREPNRMSRSRTLEEKVVMESLDPIPECSGCSDGCKGEKGNTNNAPKPRNGGAREP